MPNPTRAQFHTDEVLTDQSFATFQDPAGFVTPIIAPMVSVDKISGKYVVYNAGDFHRLEVQPRASSTKAAGGGYRMSRESYDCERRAVRKDFDLVDISDADDVIEAEDDGEAYVTHQFLMDLEAEFITNAFTAGGPGTTWTFDADGVASSATAAASLDYTDAANNQLLQWNDANSTPLYDVSQMRLAIRGRTGRVPNVLVVQTEVDEALQFHPDILDLIKGAATPGGPALATSEVMARIFRVEKYVIMGSIRNTAKEGATATTAFQAGKHALLCYVDPKVGKRTATALKTFAYNGLPGLNGAGVRIRKYDLEEITTTVIEGERYNDVKVIAPDLGGFFGDIVA